MVGAVGRIAQAVELPVTADLEDGYGDAAGNGGGGDRGRSVGCNPQDRMGDLGTTPSGSPRYGAAGEAAGVPVVINARTDVSCAATPRSRMRSPVAARTWRPALMACSPSVRARPTTCA